MLGGDARQGFFVDEDAGDGAVYGRSCDCDVSYFGGCLRVW